MSENFSAIFRVVLNIPRGMVATYGQVGELAGFPRGARIAAAALKMSGTLGVSVPWQRVVGKRGPWGRIAILDPVGAAIARKLLEKEGVVFNDRDLIDLGEYGLSVDRKPKRARTPKRKAVAPRGRKTSAKRRTY